MKRFHISDVLSVTTGRLVSYRHMDGVYAILNFLTGDNLFTHQLPRAMDECRPWLRTQFPKLMADEPDMAARLATFDAALDRMGRNNKPDIDRLCSGLVAEIQTTHNLPEMLPVYEMGADMYTHIDPVEEAEARVGKGRVIKLEI